MSNEQSLWFMAPIRVHKQVFALHERLTLSQCVRREKDQSLVTSAAT